MVVTIEPRRQQIKKYHFPDLENNMKRLFIPINSERKSHEEILVIDVKGEQGEVE